MRFSSFWHGVFQALLSLFAGTLCIQGAYAQDLVPVPQLSAHVVDLTASFSPSERLLLESKLQALEASTGSQVVVLVVPTTGAEDIAAYANRVGNVWKVGRKEVGDGLILLIAKDDRKVRIEVAKTLEGAIPDLMARRVIDQAIAPHFKQGSFFAGVDGGIEHIAGLIRGEGLPPPTASFGTSPHIGGFQWMDLAVFLFFAAAIGGSMARRAFGTRGGSLLVGIACSAVVYFVSSTWWLAGLAGLAGLLLTLLTSLSKAGRSRGPDGGIFGGSSSWRGDRSSGGGFRSGGGGNFGGGGASGGW